MKIETRYDINDEVWFIHPYSKKAISGVIAGIRCEVKSKPEYRTGDKKDRIKTGEYLPLFHTHYYQIDDRINKNFIGLYEYDLFKSKEDLSQSLIDKAKEMLK